MEPEEGTAVARGGLWLRALAYVALVVGLSNLLVLDAVDHGLLEPARLATAKATGAVLSLFSDEVRVLGQRVFLGSSAVEIVNSCTGIDVAIFLASAMLVFPAPWRLRASGVLAAFAIVGIVNFLRVLTLCWLNASSQGAFELVHVYIWPAFITIVYLATLLLWIQLVPARNA